MSCYEASLFEQPVRTYKKQSICHLCLICYDQSYIKEGEIASCWSFSSSSELGCRNTSALLWIDFPLWAHEAQVGRTADGWIHRNFIDLPWTLPSRNSGFGLQHCRLVTVSDFYRAMGRNIHKGCQVIIAGVQV